MSVTPRDRAPASPDALPAVVRSKGIRRRLRALPILIAALFSISAVCGQKDPLEPPRPGSIAVVANLAGATIILDGTATSFTTSDTLTGISPGAHVVKVALADHTADPESVAVTVVEDGLATAQFVLTPIVHATAGSLAVLTNVPGAAILLDGVTTARAAPDTLENVEAGVHGVTVSLDGYTSSPESVAVTVGVDSLSTVEFTLTEIVELSRVVLLEQHTNWGCNPCPPADEKIVMLTEEFPYAQLVVIAYHNYIPFPNDPWYLANITDSEARRTYYGVTNNPSVFLDGEEFSPSPLSWSAAEAYPLLRDAFTDRAAVPPELSVTVTQTIDGSTLTADAEVTAHADFSGGGLTLHFVVVEELITLASPSPNGSTEFHFVMRKMLPTAEGEALAIADGATLHFQQQTSIDASWQTSELGTIVFVQRNDTSKEVLQAAGAF